LLQDCELAEVERKSFKMRLQRVKMQWVKFHKSRGANYFVFYFGTLPPVFVELCSKSPARAGSGKRSYVDAPQRKAACWRCPPAGCSGMQTGTQEAPQARKAQSLGSLTRSRRRARKVRKWTCKTLIFGPIFQIRARTPHSAARAQ
jgi:hypothetical protein